MKGDRHNVDSCHETAREDFKCSSKELTSDYHDCILKPDIIVHNCKPALGIRKEEDQGFGIAIGY